MRSAGLSGVWGVPAAVMGSHPIQLSPGPLGRCSQARPGREGLVLGLLTGDVGVTSPRSPVRPSTYFWGCTRLRQASGAFLGTRPRSLL